MTAAPFAPWVLGGESMIGLARWRGERPELPAGLARMPGPFLVSAVRYTDSPVGPFVQLTIGAPARLGMRPGWCLVVAVVDCPAARTGSRLNWGFPAELARLHWCSRGHERELVWDQRDLVVRARVHGPAMPMLVPVRALQGRGDGPVVVPGNLRGLARPAMVAVHTYPGDDLAPLAGRHPGFTVAGMRQVIREARHPVGLTATLRAPLRAPEPALTRLPAHVLDGRPLVGVQ